MTKKSKKAVKPEQDELKSCVPKFEIGVKGDDFDLKYRKAAAEASLGADRLLSDLSRESRADKYNFLGFILPFIIIVFISLSFAVINRGDIEERLDVKPTASNLLSGRYFKNLTEVYEDTLPYSNEIKKLGGALGFVPKPAEDNPDEPDDTDNPNDTDEPETTTSAEEVTEPAATTTEPVTTTEPAASSEPTAETEETASEEEIGETFIMYANATLNVRLGPTTEDAVVGYFKINDPVEVIEIRGDGWAAVIYDGIKAYAYAEYLGEETVETTVKTRAERTEAETEEPEPEVTSAPDSESAEETVLPDESAETEESAETDGLESQEGEP